MVALATPGGHFQDPRLFIPITNVAASFNIVSNANATTVSSSTAFFTEYAARGLQDQTNWTAATYKTLLSVSSGFGLVAGMIGPTAGGAETTTFEITVDGVLSTITITNANTERAILTVGGYVPTPFTTNSLANALGTLAASATTFQTIGTLDTAVPDWGSIGINGTPCLFFRSSLLIRAKHSATVTNSTATAYSGVMYRLGIAA